MHDGKGVLTIPSRYSVGESLDRLSALLAEKSVKVFARVDHGGEAAKAGLSMPPTELLIFGNPKGGTPIMLDSPLSAIALPVKALAWQDAQGAVWVSYEDPHFLAERFRVHETLLAPLFGLIKLIEQAVA